MEQRYLQDKYLSNLAEKAKRKELFSIQEQISYLRYKGINILEKDEALVEDILKNRTYYFKVTAYRKNFSTDKYGKFVNLSFLQLADLAKIDMYLRMILGKMIFELEHSLKTLLLKFITESNIDGYNIVHEFNEYTKKNYLKYELKKRNENIDNASEMAKQLILQNYTDTSEKIMNNVNGEFGYDVDFYQHHHQKISIWALLEIMTLNQLNTFIIFYCDNKYYGYKNLIIAQNILKYVTNVRNACAHNRPLIYNIVDINQFNKSSKKQNRKKRRQTISLTQFLQKANVDRNYHKFLTNKKMNDIVAVIYLHDTYIHTKEMKQKDAEALFGLINRIKREKDFYQNNQELKERFYLFQSIVQYYSKKNNFPNLS